MRILLANYRYFISGGPERYMFNLMAQLSRLNHDVIPFSINYNQNLKNHYDKYFVEAIGNPDEVYFDQQKMTLKTFIRTLSRLFYSFEVEEAVRNLATEFQPDIAYVLHYLRKMSPSLLVGLKKKKVPIIVRLSDYAMLCPQAHCLHNNENCTLCFNGNILNSISKKCVKESFSASVLNCLATWYHKSRGYFDLIDSFVTTNEFMFETMINAGYPEKKIKCIPTFTDTETFSPSEDYSKDNYISYIGRLEDLKGVHILIRAFIMLKKRIKTDIVLKIGGTGSPAYTSMIKTIISEAKMENEILLLGNLDEQHISKLLSKSLLNVVPSLCFENLPNSIIESYACGTPVIASDTGSLSKCVKKGLTGDLFITGDSNDLADKIEHYINNQTLLNGMAIMSRNEALNSYSPNSHLKSLMMLFDNYI